MKLPHIPQCNHIDFMFKYSRDKNVLHIGCAHVPATERELQKGTLVHQRLMRQAAKVTGVDISESGIRLMQEAGIPDLYVIDAEQSLIEHLGQTYDVIIAGAVIEHVVNMGLFLESLKSVCHQESVVVLTTINSVLIKRFFRLLYRNEVVHPDHVCYFSYATLSCLLNKCGYQPFDWGFYWIEGRKSSKPINAVLKRIPFLQCYADGICVACKIL